LFERLPVPVTQSATAGLPTWRNTAAPSPRQRRTEAFGNIFVVTNLENGRRSAARCRTAAPTPQPGLDFSLGAARQIGCDGLCRVTLRRAGYE
jgi:hypothetical protein